MASAADLLAFFRSYFTPAGRQAAWNLAWMLGGRLVSQASLLLVVLLLTRALGREQFGIFATSLALQGYIVILGTAGMPAVVVRECVRRPQDRGVISSTYLVVAWLLGALAAVLLASGGFFLQISLTEKVLLATMAIGAAASCGNPQPIFDALHRQAVPAVILALADVALLVAVAVVCSLDAVSLVLVGVLFSAKWVVAMVGMVARLQPLVPLALAHVRLAEATQLWRSSWPLFLAGLLSTVPITGGTLLVRWFNGAGEAALMGLATQVLQGYLMLAALAHRLVNPHVAGPYGFERRFILKLAGFYFLYLGGLYAAAVGGSYVLVRWVLQAAYTPALGPCCVMATAGLVGGLGTAINNYLVVMHRERGITVSYAAAALVMLGIGLTVAPAYGAMGQSLASLAGFLALLVVNLVWLVGTLRGRRGPAPGSHVGCERLTKISYQ